MALWTIENARCLIKLDDLNVNIGLGCPLFHQLAQDWFFCGCKDKVRFPHLVDQHTDNRDAPHVESAKRKYRTTDYSFLHFIIKNIP